MDGSDRPEGQGNLILFKGKFISQETGNFVLLCPECGRVFQSKRSHTITCSAACRKRRSRRLSGEVAP